MPSFICGKAVWEVDDFSPCFKERYIQGAIPLLLLAFSVVGLVRPLATIFSNFSRRPAIEASDEFDVESMHTAALYRLRTTDGHGGDLADTDEDALADAESPMLAGEVEDDFELVFLKPRGTRARAAFEQLITLSLLGWHSVLFVLLALAPLPPGSDRLDIVSGEIVAIAILKHSRVIADVPASIWIHSAMLYLWQWVSAMINLYSTYIGTYSAMFSNLSAAVDSLGTTALIIISLMSPIGRIPAYIETSKGTEPNPEPFASLWDILVIGWMHPLLTKGLKRPLVLDDIWDLSARYRAKSILAKYRSNTRGSFIHRLMKYCASDFMVSSIWTAAQSCASFAPTLLIRSILHYLEDPTSTPRHVAWLYVALITVTPFVVAICDVQSQWGFRGLSIRLRELLVGELYSKSLSRSSASVAENKPEDSKATDLLTNGAIINLMAVDSFTISEATIIVQQLIKLVVMMVISLALLFDLLGISAIAAIFSMIALIPGNYYVSKYFGITLSAMMAYSDQRVQKTNEVLQSIKIIKYFAWEPRFAAALEEVRNKEMEKLRHRYYLWSGLALFWYGFIPFITFFTFGFYTLVAKQQLTATVAFTSISLFTQMRTPIEILVDSFSMIVEALVSIKRVERYLSEEGTTKYAQMACKRDASSPHIGFQNASFSWTDEGAGDHVFKLKDINIDFPVEKLTVIVGPTGSGKTSLLMALLGEMTLLKGKVFLPSPKLNPTVGQHGDYTESIAYCAQQAWLLNDSIKNNILFGSPYIATRYKACVHACALLRDMEILEYGDQTPIGEKGIALSGGQKQRISLARALYSQARHVILDDCLSAVDSHSAQWIYEKAILGPLMKGRTCLLVSHNVALTITGADHVVAVENGTVKVQGTPEEVFKSGILGDDDGIRSAMSRSSSRNPSRATSISNISALAANDVANEPEDPETEILIKSRQAPDQIEDVEQGSVTWDVYFTYLRAMGSYFFWIVLASVYLSQQGMQLIQTYWLTQWTKDLPQTDAGSEESNHSSYYYFWYYGLASLLYIVISVLRPLVTFTGSIRASKGLFKSLLQSVFRATPRFFDTTPVGRILNRFSKDVETIDRNVASDLYGLGYTTLLLSVVIITISFIFPAFLIAGILIAAVYGVVTVLYLASARELRRINSVTRSPIYQHFGETLAGLSTIRAYGCEQRFIEQNIARLESNTRPYWAFWGLMSWLTLRSDLVGGAVMAITSAFLVKNSSTIDAGLAGLCLTYAVNFSSTTMWFVTSYTNTEMDMNSVERVKEYLELESEAPDVIEGRRTPANWPEHGAIEVKDLSLRYAPELPRVIDGVSFSIKPHMKVGIVGRTGAGKSTIASAFFRFIEADSGSITIDGIDLSTIGLRDLRSALTIIPQDPALFNGTVRSNLDPFDLYSDSDIHQALRRVKLIDDMPRAGQELTTAQKSNPFLSLSSPITEGGGNISQGQRQLVCLARSLLRSPKVIILDEATASIDYDTDAQIQLTIRKEFSNSTILTIAHRLRSIIDYDMILVLESGKVKEYNAPHLLLQDPDSTFRSMCDSSGELQVLAELAAQAYEQRVML